MTMKIILIALMMLAVVGISLSIPPRTPAPLAALNQAFANASMAGLPPLAHFRGADGQGLAYRHYRPQSADSNLGSVTLMHGSSADSRSMHPLAQALARTGFAVYTLDIRGHGASGEHGHIAYLGQLDNDLHQFVTQVQPAQPALLGGFSAGGGLAFRIAAGAHSKDFAGYLLLAPFLGHDAPTSQAGNGDWGSISLPRMITLTVLNRLGITAFNPLPVLRFALDDWGQQHLTPTYDYNLAFNMRPGPDLTGDIARLSAPMALVVGHEDTLMRADAYATLFEPSPLATSITRVAGADHAGLILQADAISAIVTNAKRLMHTAALTSTP